MKFYRSLELNRLEMKHINSCLFQTLTCSPKGFQNEKKKKKKRTTIILNLSEMGKSGTEKDFYLFKWTRLGIYLISSFKFV